MFKTPIVSYFSALQGLDKTNNGPESWHSATADRIPTTRGDLNAFINALAKEDQRQDTRLVQASEQKKKYGPSNAQIKLYESIALKCRNFPNLSPIEYLKQFCASMSMPLSGTESTDVPEVEDVPATATAPSNSADLS